MKVMIVKREGETAVVEWREEGTPYRSIVPVSALTVAQPGLREAECEYPERGIPYGEDFSLLITPAATPESVDRALKLAGIWTAEDLHRNPNGAIGALQRAYGVDLAALLSATRQQLKGKSQ